MPAVTSYRGKKAKRSDETSPPPPMPARGESAFRLVSPFAPAGDLYNDATTEWDSYLEQTYKAMESMLTVLENCSTVDYTIPVGARPFQCGLVDELNRL